jgi:cytochrome c
LGRTGASAEGFNYSPVLKGANIQWGTDQLEAYLANPTGMVPGTRMVVRVASASDRADIIAYLQGMAVP